MHKKEKSYSLAFTHLKEGVHEFDYPVGKDLLDIFESDLVEDITGHFHVKLTKTSASMMAHVRLEGQATLLCDRSLELFDYPFSAQETVVFKPGEAFAEIADNVYSLSPQQFEIDFSQIIYDLLAVSIPTRRIHPDYLDEEEQEGDVAYYTTASEDDDDATQDQEEQADEQPIDPRWEALKKLK